MKEIIIKEIRLLNFKGIRELTVDFTSLTEIAGWNGTGKTTIADAINWLLFGKDSKNREKFNIKTLDEKGRIIYKLPHEVSGILLVDGNEVRLTQRINEKWRKDAEGQETIFAGNEWERLYNDVPCTEREYKAKIAEICKEEDFKYLTNPSYFCSRDTKIQKAKLLEMAGEITDKEIAAGNADFKHLLTLLKDKTLEEFKKELKTKKNRIEADITGIPDRIDENKRKLPEQRNWSQLETELEQKENSLREIEERIMDEAKRNEAQDDTIREIYAEISKIRDKISKRELEISKEANKDFYKAQERHLALRQEVMTIDNEIKLLDRKIEEKRFESIRKASERNVLIEEWKNLGQQEKQISERQLTFSENQFICPTCHRTYELENIEAMQVKIRESFEAQKKADLGKIAEAKAVNMGKGAECSKAVIAGIEAEIASLTQQQNELRIKKESILASPEYKNEPTMVDIRPLVTTDNIISGYEREIEGLQKKATLVPKKIDLGELNLKRGSINAGISAIKDMLRSKRTYDELTDRIKELEDRYKSQSAALNELARLESLADEFSKAKNREVARRIDSLFEKVHFQWIEYQVNGSEKETCVASIDGVPYADLNSAGQITAGLDIINAISRHMGIVAPIMIDNAESCNEFIDTAGQKILFKVTTDKELKITNL